MQTASKQLTIVPIDSTTKTAVETMAKAENKKANLADEHPPEKGCHLRGDDFSSVAAVVILRWEWEKTPPSIQQLVRVAIKIGAVLTNCNARRLITEAAPESVPPARNI